MINSQQQVPGVSTIDSPAATTNGANYVVAWTASNQAISWTTCPADTTQPSYVWATAAAVPNAASSGGPALANFGGKVWMAWKGEGTDTRIFVAALSGSTWSVGAAIAGIGTSSAPAPTATSSGLYLVWKGESDTTIRWSKSADGKTWSGQAVVAGFLSSDTPALASFNGIVYLAAKGASDNSISLSQYTDAKGWGTATVPSSVFATSGGPALAVGDTGNLHLVWKGASDTNVFRSTLVTGKTVWSPQQRIATIRTSTRPALASQLSSPTDITLAWKGGSDDDLWAAPIDNLPAVVLVTPPGAITGGSSISWAVPDPLPPAPPNGPNAPDAENFGSWTTQAAFACELVLSSDGTATFSGWYQDQGTLPIGNSPSQKFSVAAVIVTSNKKCFTFTYTNNNGVPTGGVVDKWKSTGGRRVVRR